MNETSSVLIAVVAHIVDERQVRLFERAIESLMALDTTSDIQASLLVIDNASPRPIATLLKGRAATLVQTVRRDVNNIGAARGQAVEAAIAGHHDWLAFVDGDIEVPTDWLLALFSELRTNPMRDAIGIASVNRPPHEGDFARALDFFLSYEFAHLGSTQVLQLPAVSNQQVMKRKVDHLATCAVLLKTKALQDAGGFDPLFSRVGEDLELSYRLKRLGSLWLLSAPVVLHRQDRSAMDWMKRMFRYGWGQMDVARKFPEHVKTKKGIPLIAGGAVLLSFLLVMFGFAGPLKLVIILYLAMIAAPLILKGISEGQMDTAFHACWIAFVTHAGYAAGMWAGLLKLKRNPLLIPSDDGKRVQAPGTLQ